MMGLTKRSLLNKYFSKELLVQLLRATKVPDCSNNEKGEIIKWLLEQHGIQYEQLGSGTNRIGILIDGYAFKFALDIDGQIDNRREMKYSKILQPYVVKCYECIPNGLINVTEYIRLFNINDFTNYKKQMGFILNEISDMGYLLGDVGITGKNYENWGVRLDGTICILDFAYCYNVKYNVFKCSCEEEGLLGYESTFVKLICPRCGREYRFEDIRRRITKEQQEAEIGDTHLLGYNITKDVENVPMLIPEFEPDRTDLKEKKKAEKKAQKEKIRKMYDDYLKKQERSDYWSS